MRRTTMNLSQFQRRTSLALCFLALAGIAYGQAQQGAQFEPQVGQAGKDVVWVPTPQELVNKMLDLAKVTPQDYLIDLGSGDGRTVITAAKRGVRALGIEYNAEMVALSKANAEKAGVASRAQFEQADLFDTDLSRATVIPMFLLPGINLKLRPTLLNLKPGTRIVSNTFTMGEWEPEEKFTIPQGCPGSWCTALLWIVPARVAGSYKTPAGYLTLKQEYQMLSGTLIANNRTVPLEGRVRGDELS